MNLTIVVKTQYRNHIIIKHKNTRLIDSVLTHTHTHTRMRVCSTICILLISAFVSQILRVSYRKSGHERARIVRVGTRIWIEREEESIRSNAASARKCQRRQTVDAFESRLALVNSRRASYTCPVLVKTRRNDRVTRAR